MKKLWLMMCVFSLLFIPVLAQAQSDNLMEIFFGQGEREVRLDRISVSQMEMIPDDPRDNQPVGFRASITNNSRHDVRIGLAVVDNDRVVTQLNDVYLRPGINQVDFPQANIQFPRGEQRCFTIQTNVDRRWVPIAMDSAFCVEGARRDWRVDLSVEGLRMNPDPAAPGEEVTFEVRIKNDGRPLKGNIRIQDSNQIVVQTDTIKIPRGVTKFNLPRTRYSLQHLDTCFKVIVDVDRTRHEIDASEEYCATPTAWTLRTKKREHKRDKEILRGN